MSDDANETRPKWREDFPIPWEMDHYVTRREFTKFMVLVSGATVAGHAYFPIQSVLKSQRPAPSLEIARTGDVPVGGVKLFRYPTDNDPAILIRVGEEQWSAFMQRCTHLSCPVLYSHGAGRIVCPCHNGAFDPATGEVLEGPPPRPLPRISLRIDDGRIYAEGIETTGAGREKAHG